MSLKENIKQPTNQTVEVIGFGRRLIAFLIDGAILWLVLNFFYVIIGTNEYNVLLDVLTIIITFCYFVGFWSTRSQTPGKMAMGIKIIGIDGRPVSLGRAILRYIGYFISWAVFLLGFVWIGFDKKRQGWHDKIASTYIVRKDTHFSSTDTVTIVSADTGSRIFLLGLIPIFIFGVIFVIAMLLLFGPMLANMF